MRVFFTADTHFGHENILRYCSRPWGNVADMNAGLIERWNLVVGPDDVVWHLGDVFGRQQDWDLVDALNGHKHLIAGNHDSVWSGNRDAHKHQREWLRHFESVSAFARRKVGGREVMLSHFPYEGDHTSAERFSEYRLVNTGRPLLCGHVHTEWRVNKRMLNVGVDVNDWTPVELGAVEDWVTT